MVPLALVPNLTTIWYHLHKLQIWPPSFKTCILCGSRLCYQWESCSCICRTGKRIAAEQQLKLYFWAGLFSQWSTFSFTITTLLSVFFQVARRHLHWFQCCPPGWVTCIATLPGIALLTLHITHIATLPWSALLALSVSIELVYSSARVTSV